MRTSLLLLAFVGAALACLATPAQAQMAAPYNLVVSLAPPEDPLTAERTSLEFAGKVTYVGDVTSALNLNGVAVQYKITQAPTWAAVTVSPGSDVIMLTQGQQYVGSASFTVSVFVDAGALSSSEVGVIEITATAMPSAPLSYPKNAAGQAAVQFYVPPHGDDCEEHATAAALLATTDDAPAAAPQDEDDTLQVQTAGAAPTGTWYAVAGFGLVGAGVGLLLRRRFKA